VIFDQFVIYRRYWLMSTGSAVHALPRTRTRFGERGFFYSDPAAWNTLPSNLHDISLLIPVHSENDSRVYLLIVLTTDYCWRSWTYTYSGALQIL